MASIELYSGVAPQVLDYTLHVTHGSFLAGDLVHVATNGKLQVADTQIKYMGIARMKAGDTLGTSKIPVELINVNSIYSVRLTDAGTDTTTGVTDTCIGDGFGFNFTAGAQTVADTITADVYCVGRDSRDTSGTVGGRLLVRFLGTALVNFR